MPVTPHRTPARGIPTGRRPRRAALLGALAVTAALLAGVLPAAGPAGASSGGARTAAAPAAPSGVRVYAEGAGRAGSASWTTSDALVPVTTGPDDDVSFDIDTRLYVPRGASATSRRPAVLMTHGFGLTKDSTEVVATARFLAAHGYLVLTYTSSGFGQSGGCVTLQSADWDVKNAMQVMDALLEPRNDVKRRGGRLVVGTIGGSYGGGIQLPLAAADPRIRASIVGRTWNALQYSLDPNNYVVPGDPTGFSHLLNAQGVFKQQWTSLFYALGQAQPVQGNGGCPDAKAASGDPAETASIGACPGYRLELCETYSSLTASGDADETMRTLIARASAETFLPDVHAAVMLVQGQSDTLFNLNDAAATYTALKRQGTPVAMIWNSGGHGGYTSQPGECEAYDGVDRSVAEMDRCYLPRRALGWFDHYLRGRDGGRGAGFSYYRDWVAHQGDGSNADQYGNAGRFPTGQGLTLTLSGSDALVTDGAVPGTAVLVNPPGGEPAAYSETSNFTGSGSSPSVGQLPPREIEGQYAAFDTAPLAAPTDVVGVPSAHLAITNTNGQDMVFFAKVYDVAPDGSTTLIHRLIAPVRVPADAVGDPVDLRLAGFAHRFEAGHRIRLVLCTTDQTSYNAKVPDLLTVVTGADSTFTLPVVGGVPTFE